MDYTKWFEETSEKNIVNDYYETVLEDKTGKYMFISKRRVKWFLLSQVHLKDCTLTYEKLWNPEIKDKLLNKLEILSNNLNVYPELFLLECPHKINDNDVGLHTIFNKNGNSETNVKECMTQIRQEKMEGYCNGIRKEYDLMFRSWYKGDSNDPYDEIKSMMTDEEGEELTMYCYNGECQDNHNKNMIYRYKKNWFSDYFVGHLVNKFLLKIMLYDKILLNTSGETFGSHTDSSPMSDLESDVDDYLDQQYTNVTNVVGEEEAKRLEKIRKELYECSQVCVTIFDVYRMFYVFGK